MTLATPASSSPRAPLACLAILAPALAFASLAHAAAPAPSTLGPGATVDAGSPAAVVTTVVPSVGVPVTLSRTDTTPILGFSVTFSLSPGLTTSAGAIAEGGFMTASGGTTSFHVTDNGDGTFTVDDVTLGIPCGSGATSGTLFTIAVGSTLTGGTGTVTIQSVTLRDCSNATLPSSPGAAGTVAVDRSVPAVTVTSPNGGEAWVAGSSHAITWTASDAEGIASNGIQLDVSTDGGSTWSPVASGLANSGTFAWTVPNTPSATARVRATALDVNGNPASDASDAVFTIQAATTTSLASSLNPAPLGASVTFTATVAPASATGSVEFFDSATSLGASPLAGGTAALSTSALAAGSHPITAVYAGDALDGGSTSAILTQVVHPAVLALTDLAAAQVRTGNDRSGTTKITLTWTPVPAGSTVEVWRKGFGNYPEYDDGATPGSVPTTPAGYPPAGWTLTTVAQPGDSDQPGTRDFWYYVAYVRDAFGTLSPVSNPTGGTLDYHLGDVSDGTTAGAGDNQVTTSDVSVLGLHYGLTGAAEAPYDYLDVGPTTDLSVTARPTTDHRINFEDLVMFGINYYPVASAPATHARPAASASDAVTLSAPAQVSAGDDVAARVLLSGTGLVLGLSVRLQWDPALVEPVSFTAGDLVTGQGGVVLSADPGSVDGVSLAGSGQGLVGDGEFATLHFRALAAGDPKFGFARIDARDRTNRAVHVNTGVLAVAPKSWVTALAPATPNPFARATTFQFSLGRAGAAELAVFSVNGRRVRTLWSGVREAGEYRVDWNGADDSGRPLAAGVYYARLTTPQGRFTRVVTFLR